MKRKRSLFSSLIAFFITTSEPASFLLTHTISSNFTRYHHFSSSFSSSCTSFKLLSTFLYIKDRIQKKRGNKWRQSHNNHVHKSEKHISQTCLKYDILNTLALLWFHPQPYHVCLGIITCRETDCTGSLGCVVVVGVAR